MMESQRKIPIILQPQYLDFAIIGLIILLYGPIIIHWYDGWMNKSISIEHEYFSHGIIGLPFAVYIAWTHRLHWAKIADKTDPLGGIFLGVGGVLYLSGVSDLVNLSFPLVLAGLCLWLKGIAGLKLQQIPLIFTLLATPNHLPFLIEPIALPLQKFIAAVAGFILLQFNLNVTVNEIYLFVNQQTVEVAPHCAGLKMLFTSLYVALMLLYWTGLLSSRNKSILVIIGAVLLSVTANIIRNTLLTLFHGTGQTGLFHWLHDSWGGDLYSAAMLGLLVVFVNWVQDYFIDDETEFDSP